MGGIKIKNLSFSYNENVVFNNLNFSLKKDKSLSIIGPSGCGKTTFLKLLNNDLEFTGNLLVDNTPIEDLDDRIAVVFRDSGFLCDTVKDELIYSLKQRNISNKEINTKLDDINNFFNVQNIFNTDLDDLNTNDKTLIKILSYAINDIEYIAIDDLFIDLNTRTEILLLNYLNSRNIILINVTSDLEDTLYTDYTLCLFDGISAIDGKTLDVLNNEKILKRLGFSLPFMVDLSIQLKAYNLIEKVYLNKEVMVKNLWK